MAEEIFTRSIVLHIDKKKIPPLTLKDADDYLRDRAASIDNSERVNVNIDIVFEDGLKLSEEFSINNVDTLIESIIRYHMIGIIRFKAGLLKTTSTNQNNYKESLYNIDTAFYKEIYEKYSFFYSLRHLHNKNRKISTLDKLKKKYTALIYIRKQKIEKLKTEMNNYEGILVGLGLATKDHTVSVTTYTSKLKSMVNNSVDYPYISGIITGINMGNENYNVDQ